MTDLPTIDLAKARELLAKAVETQGRDFQYKPEFVGQVCFYFATPDAPEGDPRRTTGCLVGVALGLHGHDVSDLVGPIGEVWRQNRSWMTEEACRYFAKAQVEQDKGKTWGHAYDCAEFRVTDGTLHEVWI